VHISCTKYSASLVCARGAIKSYHSRSSSVFGQIEKGQIENGQIEKGQIEKGQIENR
jgi:hypothetical protein